MTGEKALIEIRVAGLPKGRNMFDFTCTAAEFHDAALIEAGFSDRIAVHVTVDRSDSELDISLKTVATAALSCDLCLTPINVELTGSYRMSCVYGKEEEISGEDSRSIDENTVSIDLTEDVRETLLLSVPMKIHCQDYPGCLVYRTEEDGETGSNTDDESSWQESLRKLKSKYR